MEIFHNFLPRNVTGANPFTPQRLDDLSWAKSICDASQRLSINMLPKIHKSRETDFSQPEKMKQNGEDHSSGSFGH